MTVSTVSSATRLRPGPGVLMQRVDDAVVLLNIASGEYYALDEIGGRIWLLCDAGHDLAEVHTALCAEFDAPPATIEADMLELVRDLLDERLLVAST